ncbi:hypothetical protein ONZ45_g2137 [Pleurotus djamor]|nr:hypothetical protein ONZ45_g2137 [Pleurotus djamor]
MVPAKSKAPKPTKEGKSSIASSSKPKTSPKEPTKPQSKSKTHQPEPSTKFVSNALNKARSVSKKTPTPIKPKQPLVSSTSKKSKLAPPSDSGESSEEDRHDEDKVENAQSDEENESSAEEEEDAPLHGLSSDDDGDSSDEDDDMEESAAIDVGKLPTIAKDDETVKRKLEKAKRKPTEDRGVIYLGRLPHGFFEDQLKAYFSQFGDVTRLRVSRNKRTGHSKHRAFLEFDSSSVAQIVADTMDNYLLMGHLLICKVIPKDKVHPELWVGANRKWRKVPTARVSREAHNKPRTEEEIDRATKRLLKRQNEKKRKLAASGISYNMDKVAYKKIKAA